MKEMEKMRIGYGYDLHRLTPRGKGLILGGIHIPYYKQTEAHSDGDVLLHAICDALLGAAALGDIGMHFPDTEEKWRDVSSSLLVTETMSLLRTRDFRPINIDTVIVLQEPSITPYKEDMKLNIANLLDLGRDRVNVKATTNEGQDALGKSEAIAAHCVCLLCKTPSKP